MSKKAEIVRKAEAEISRLETNIKRLNEQRFKQEAEVKAYKNLIEWHSKIERKSSGTKSNSNSK